MEAGVIGRIIGLISAYALMGAGLIGGLVVIGAIGGHAEPVGLWIALGACVFAFVSGTVLIIAWTDAWLRRNDDED